MTLTDLYLHATRSHFPGLANTPVVWLTDADIRARFAAMHRGMIQQAADLIEHRHDDLPRTIHAWHEMQPAYREAVWLDHEANIRMQLPMRVAMAAE